MVIGIVVGSLVVLGVLGAIGAGLSGSGFPEARYRLTVPKTLVDGKYQLVQDHSDTEGKKALQGTYDSKIRDPKPAVGQYAFESPRSRVPWSSRACTAGSRTPRRPAGRC